ncbi:DUF4150 domain-containing protein [Thauera sp. SDU_THAU2]|uniref:DUF4150 domain-containing protein n=1 Tax=Thauera sp. SDU_THAU2 TaxID=3136633 RepID=UPI00311F0E10
MADENIVSKDARFRLVSLAPDVCITPSKKGSPVPYPITHTMDQSQQCSPNVFLQGKAVYLHNESFVDNVKGDEPGAGKGVVSGTHTTISHNIDKSSNVYVNGRPIVRTGDSMWMNWKSMGPAAPSPKTPVSTGLGESVDDLVGKSPTLEADIEKLKESGWKIEYGPPGEGSYADPANPSGPQIILDGNLKGDPEQAVQVLSHEVGHATYTYAPDFSSKAAYVNGALADEGAATMKNIQVQREILANGGPDIGIAGTPANHAGYNAAYDAYLKTGDASAARQSIGNIFGSGEQTSTTGQTYSDYYGSWYDKTYGTEK